MRLRQLGTTQSVVFFAPPEVHQSILDCQKKTNHDKIDSSDVVTWLLEQTCKYCLDFHPIDSFGTKQLIAYRLRY